MKIYFAVEREDLNKMGYPVMVEMWDRVMGTGSGKRRFKAEFTKEEQRLIREYYKIFYGWMMRTGTPAESKMQFKTYQLLQRAIGFFASF